jgi:hypothetical protein
MVACLCVALFGMAALVVDLGHVRTVRMEMRSVADASALAGANRLYLNGSADTAAAVQAVKAYALENYGVSAEEWAGAGCADADALPVTAPQTECISFDSATAPTEVRVTLPDDTVDTPLATVVGTSQVTVTASANAAVSPDGATDCGLCVLGAGLHDVQNGNIVVSHGNVAMNGTVTAKQNGGVEVTGGTLSVKNGRSGSKGSFPSEILTGTTVTDPLAALPMPVIPPGFANNGAVDPCSAGGGPGWYTTFSALSSCALDPGLYVIAGDTKLAGHHDISGSGVTLYFVCGSFPTPTQCGEETSWDFDLNSQNTHMNITAATDGAEVAGAVPGLAIVADRNWAGTMSFQGGGGGGTTTGTIYLAGGTLSYGGNTQGDALNSSVVVNEIAMNGNPATFTIDYLAEQNVGVPGLGVHLCHRADTATSCN